MIRQPSVVEGLRFRSSSKNARRTIGESIVSPHIVHLMSLPTKLMSLLEN